MQRRARLLYGGVWWVVAGATAYLRTIAESGLGGHSTRLAASYSHRVKDSTRVSGA